MVSAWSVQTSIAS